MSMTEDEIAAVVARVMAEFSEPPEVEQQAVNLGMFQVAPGQTILADHMNSAIQTGVPKFASATARDAQWPAPPIGAMCYLTDSNYLQIFDNQITGGANAWHPVGGMRMGYAQMGSGQAIPNNVDTILTLTAASGAANKAGRATWNADGTVTLPLTGTYLASGNLTWPGNNTGDRQLFVKKWASASGWTLTGVSGGSAELNAGAVGTSSIRQSVSAQVYASAGEKLALIGRQMSGGSLTLPGGADIQNIAHFTVHLLGAD